MALDPATARTRPTAGLGLARRLEKSLGKHARPCADDPALRLALYRAFLTAILGAMDRADDSFGALGDLFHTTPDFDITLRGAS